MEYVTIAPNPARLLQAIANFGYDTEVALCDIIDNSIDADAQKILLNIVEEVNDTAEETDVIQSYVIVDDGIGMDRDKLLDAFTLGSDRPYGLHELGKFGMGLKSAALSLGGRLTVITKEKDSDKPLCGILSFDYVEAENDYAIEIGEPDAEVSDFWRLNALNLESGTVVRIDILNDSQPSHSKFREFMQRYCAITYHMFMVGDEKLEITVNRKDLKPIDPLFAAEADENGSLNPQDWDGQSTRRLLKPIDMNLADDISCKVEATQLVHPPSFTDEGKRQEMRDHYMVDRDPYKQTPRHGFYIYRNRRVIVMAERFRGIISNQTSAWAFRGRLMLDETADKVVSLDVKKRHCFLPNRARTNLRSLIQSYQTLSTEAWKTAGQKERQNATEKRQVLAEKSVEGPIGDLDYAPGSSITNDDRSRDRKDAQSQIARQSESDIQDPELKKKIIERSNGEGTVEFAAGLKANAMWLPHPDVVAGKARTLLNKNHSWVANAFDAAEDNPKLYVALYQLFTILGRAELEVRTHGFSGISSDDAGRVLDNFRKKASVIGEDLSDQLEKIFTELDKVDLDEQ